MTEQECLAKLIAPGQRRETKWLHGVIQIIVTNSCDNSCYGCTQGSNLSVGKPRFMTPEQYEDAVKSLKGYFGVVGTFGGNPSISPFFKDYCAILREHVPFSQRGLWSNNPIKPENAIEMRKTFNPAVSNLNVHLDQNAYKMFKQYWPESMPCGLTEDSRHSPPFVAMKDVLRTNCPDCNGLGWKPLPGKLLGAKTVCLRCVDGQVYDESRAWELISGCDINKHWSAAIGVFRGQLRAWFCEIAASQSILHQDNPDYPDTGIPIRVDGLSEFSQGDGKGRHTRWWQEGMTTFAYQVRKHCQECGIPLRGHGALAQGSDETQVEQVSETHKDIYTPKRKGRRVELVTVESQLGKPLGMVTKYLQNSRVK